MTPVLNFIDQAIELSIFAAPEAPGLTLPEVVEVGSRFTYHEGEIRDCLRDFRAHFGVHQGRLVPASLHELTNFFELNEPEYRDPRAFEFMNVELRELGRRVGAAAAILDRSTLVARGVATGLSEKALQVAITVYLLADHLVVQDSGLRLAPGREHYALPSQQINVDPPRSRSGIDEIMGAVTDVVRRRADKRPVAAEPVRAFELELDALGHGRFRIWWSSTVQELRLADPRQPLGVCVLAAALAEGALTVLAGGKQDQEHAA